MNFTKEDFEKIAAYLRRTGIRDTELREADSTLDNTSIPVVQDGENRQMSAQTFVEQVTVEASEYAGQFKTVNGQQIVGNGNIDAQEVYYCAIISSIIRPVTRTISGWSVVSDETITPAKNKWYVDVIDGKVYYYNGSGLTEFRSGSGTVTGVKIGSDGNVIEPENGIIELPASQEVDLSDYVVKENDKGLSTNDYTNADKAAVDTISSKANASEVVKSISVNGQPQSKDTNGNVNIQVQSGAQGPKGDTGNVNITDADELVTILVNDLTTGGAGNILSAEMGRRLAMMSGTFAQAWARSRAIPFPFCFLWVETVDGESISKPIWHKGGSNFVDAAGSSVNVDATDVPAQPTITDVEDGEEVAKDTEITITPAPDSALYYSLDGGDSYNVAIGAVNVVLPSGEINIKAYCVNNAGESTELDITVTVEGVPEPKFTAKAGSTLNNGVVNRGGYIVITGEAGGVLHYKVGAAAQYTDVSGVGGAAPTAEVQITGATTIKAYNTVDGDDSSEVTKEFTMEALATPTFSPAAGQLLEGDTVSIEGPNGATIYYTMTTDGSTPADPTDQSTLYSGAIAVSVATTIKAIAHDTYGYSAVAEASYTIKEDEMIIDTTDATATVTLKYNDTNSEKQTVTLNLDSTTTAEGGGYRNTIAINQTNFPNLNANKQFSSIAFSDKNKIKRFYGGGGKYAFAPSQLNSCTSIALIDADITNSSGYRSFYGIGSVNGVVNLILRGSVDGINDFIRGGSTTVSFTVDFSGVTTPSGGFNVPGYLITDCAGSTLTINDGFKVGSGNYKLKILNSAKLSALKIIGSSALDLTENWLGEMLASSSYGYSSSKKLTIKIDNAAKSAYEASSQWSSYLNDEKITWQDLEGNSITWNE